jgi:hypothetical protein
MCPSLSLLPFCLYDTVNVSAIICVSDDLSPRLWQRLSLSLSLMPSSKNYCSGLQPVSHACLVWERATSPGLGASWRVHKVACCDRVNSVMLLQFRPLPQLPNAKVFYRQHLAHPQATSFFFSASIEPVHCNPTTKGCSDSEEPHCHHSKGKKPSWCWEVQVYTSHQCIVRVEGQGPHKVGRQIKCERERDSEEKNEEQKTGR